MQRIVIVGTTGVGKSTLAAQLSTALNIPHIETDSLYWEENWTESTDEDFVKKLANAVNEAGESWIVDGNYSLSRALVWPKADTVIWLDYPLWLIYWRLFRRSLKRVISREKLWNNNQESFYSQFLASDSLFIQAAKTYQRRKERYSAIIENNEYPHIQFHHFQKPSETETFLKQISSSAR